MIFFRTILLSATATAAVAPALAQSGQETTLIDAVRAAYETNPTLAAERARQDATRENIAAARAGGLPQVSGNASISDREIDQTSPPGLFGAGGTETFNLETFQAGVEATQTIFAGLSNWNAIRQAKAQVRAGGAQLASVEQQVLLDAATAFLDVRRDTAVLDLRRNNVRVLSRQLEATLARFDVGEVTRTDVSQAEARLASARAEVFNAQARLAASRAQYQAIVGFYPASLATPPSAPGTPPSVEEAQAFAKANSPRIVAAEETEIASRRGVEAAYGGLAPRIDAFASYTYTEEPSFFQDDTAETAFGARATVPIFQGGRNYSNIRRAKRTLRGDKYRTQEAARAVEQQVTSAWTTLEAANATIEAATSAVSSNEIAFEGVRQEAQVGARTTLDVLDAEQELLNARVQLVTANRDAQVAAYTLLAAIGALTPERFGIQ